jgi:hypothetical protein
LTFLRFVTGIFHGGKKIKIGRWMKLSTETDKAEYKRQTGLAAVLQHSDIDV